MNFVSIPNNGSSWQESLIYSFETADAQPQDIEVEICDVGANSLLGTKRLYGVASGSIDIAPYLRSVCDLRISYTGGNSVHNTQIARNISVKLNGVESESRLFMLRSFDASAPKILTRFAAESTFSIGDVVTFSLFVPSKLNIVANIISPSSRKQVHLQWSGTNAIVDVEMQTRNFKADIELIDINIHFDGNIVENLKFNVVSPQSRHRQLLWRNSWGGVESYGFPQSLPLARAVEAESIELATHDVVMLGKAQCRNRLCSAFETEQELERISEVMLSSYIYEVDQGVLHEVEVDDRKIEYDTHGNLRQLAFDIVKEWKGGGL